MTTSTQQHDDDGARLVCNSTQLTAAYGGRVITFTRKEFRILVVLASAHDRVCSRDTLLQEVWGAGVFVDARTIDRHIVKLRRKLHDLTGGAIAIETVWGVGYGLDVGDVPSNSWFRLHT